MKIKVGLVVSYAIFTALATGFLEFLHGEPVAVCCVVGIVAALKDIWATCSEPIDPQSRRVRLTAMGVQSLVCFVFVAGVSWLLTHHLKGALLIGLAAMLRDQWSFLTDVREGR